jgi:hypothetical protein
MRTTDTAIEKRAWYREPMVWLVIAIPGLSVVVGMVMLAFSITSYDGLVVDDYYKQGVTINQRLERQSRAKSLGIQADVRLKHQEKRVEMNLTGNQAFQFPDQVTLGLHHATRAGLDTEAILIRAGDNHYIGAFEGLSAGRWHVVLQTEEWKISGSVFWPDDNELISIGY